MVRDAAVKKFPKGGFFIAALYRAPFDDMWDYINHPAVFKSEEAANRFCDKVNANIRKVNLRNWVGSDHPCAAIQADESSPAYYCPL